MARINNIQEKQSSRLFGQLLDKVVDKLGLVRCKTVQFVGGFLRDAYHHGHASVVCGPSAIGTDTASLCFGHNLESSKLNLVPDAVPHVAPNLHLLVGTLILCVCVAILVVLDNGNDFLNAAVDVVSICLCHFKVAISGHELASLFTLLAVVLVANLPILHFGNLLGSILSHSDSSLACDFNIVCCHSSRLDRDAVGLKSCFLMFLVQRYNNYLNYASKNQNKCYHFSIFNI